MLNTLDPVKLSALPREIQDRLSVLLQELEGRKKATNAQDNFLAFIAAMDKPYKFGNHLKRLAALLTDVEEGKKDRIAVSMAPRMGKSQMISIYYPAWYLGRHPEAKVIVASHTADLAIVLARKVRNLMQSADYQAIFPEVRIAADAKAAGQWNTNRGGEYFACLRRYALIKTTRGEIPAGQIRAGDRLLTCSGFNTVQQVFDSQHNATVKVLGLDCSANHPIWTMNRGWVYATDIVATDLLCVESISDRLKALIRGIYGYLEHTYVQTVAQHQVAMRESEQREVGKLWWARYNGRRAMEYVRKLCNRYGAATDTQTYCGSNRQQWSLFSRKLSMGNAYGTSQQSTNESNSGGQNARSTFTDHGDNTRSGGLSRIDGHRAYGTKAAQTELSSYSRPKNLGWVRDAASQLLISRSNSGIRKSKSRAKGYMASATEAAEKLLGVLLGVRRAGHIAVTPHTAAAPFVNFLTDGDHTFFADGVLTHNCGVGGALAGRGADLIIVDDPISEQALKGGDFKGLDSVYEWFSAGLRTRLMPNGRLCILHTRWHARDLIGRLIKDSSLNPDGDQYEIFEFPAILEVPDPDDPEKTIQKSLWPEQWSLESLLKTKASMGNMLWQWNAQYMQDPTAAESAMIKREWVKWWEKERPPANIHTIVQSWDTALTAKERSDYSYCTTWGVWDTEEGESNVILLDAVKGKFEFPELKQVAYEQFKEWEPDNLIIETKASGHSLVQELRRSGIYVQEFSPGKGQDKIARVNAISDMFASGHIWFPETAWANSLVEELLAFPAGEHDDGVDALTLALTRIRQGGILRLRSDKNDDDGFIPPRRNTAYY